MLILSLTIVCSGQVLVSGKDTVSCYTNKELKVITKAVLKGKECDTLKSICEKQLDYCDSIIEVNKKVKQDLTKLNEVCEDKFDLQEYKIKSLEIAIEQERKNVRKQKVFKYISIGVGAITTGFMTYLWVVD